MSDTAENLKAFLYASADVKAIVGDRIYEDKIPQSTLANPLPFIWFATRGETNSEELNGGVGQLPLSITFDFECVSMNKQTSKNLSRFARAILHNYQGAFGDSTVQGVFASDKDSEYVTVNGDRGQFVQAFDVEVFR